MKTPFFSIKSSKKIYIATTILLSSLLLTSLFPQLNHFGDFLTPPIALLIGIIYAIFATQSYQKQNAKLSKALLQYSIIALGFGMNLQTALASGKEGMSFTIISVFGTMLIGWIIGFYILKVDKNTAYLISSGTAICGGSAIAAVGPIINAKEHSMSIALGTIFILNSVALFLFPFIGHLLDMSQQDFGLWAAIAIHDTSSVVGAGAAYGEEALKIATMVKLTRALWIIPVSLVTMFLFKTKGKKIKLPYFIFYFILAMLFNTYYLAENFPIVGSVINAIGRKGLSLALFFIGASFAPNMIKKMGIKPMLQGVLLWIIISTTTLFYIYIVK